MGRSYFSTRVWSEAGKDEGGEEGLCAVSFSAVWRPFRPCSEVHPDAPAGLQGPVIGEAGGHRVLRREAD